MHFYILLSNLEINSADWSVSKKMGIILLPSGQCDNRSAKAALLWCHQDCLHPRMQACVRETESGRQRSASIGEQRQRQRPLVQGCSGETGDRVCFRHHIWKCWNSPHARGHPICMHLTSTQEICGRCEKKERDRREKRRLLHQQHHHPLRPHPHPHHRATQLVCSTPPFFIYFRT